MTSRTEIERLRALAKEIDGCWRVYEAGLREVMGHTNYNVIARKLADEQSVRHPSPRDDFSPENDPFKTLDRPIEELQAADEFRRTLIKHANAKTRDGAPLWYGWAVHDAFLAGMDYARGAQGTEPK